MDQKDYRELLKLYLEQRMEINPSYSLRAFARDLALSPSHFCEIMSGKKGLSLHSARRISRRLSMGRENRQEFLALVEAQDARGHLKREAARAKLLKTITNRRIELNSVSFRIVKDWYHFALREFVLVARENFSIEGAARYFGLPRNTISEALARLKSVGLVHERQGRLTQKKSIIGPLGVPDQAKKLHHLQLLKRAQRAYLTQAFDERDFYSNIVAIDRSKLPEAKGLIREFHTRMEQLLAPPGATPDQVYCFSTQLFSLRAYPETRFVASPAGRLAGEATQTKATKAWQ